MENTNAVGNYFIRKSLTDGTELTPMKLMKLTYLAHGWHLALSDAGEPLIPEAIFAWKYGPVIRSVYDSFKKYGRNQITVLEPNAEGQIVFPSEERNQFLDRIWDVYRQFSGPQLSTITHEPGSPWDIVWNQQGGKSRSNALIPNDTIRDYYRGKAAAANNQ